MSRIHCRIEHDDETVRSVSRRPRDTLNTGHVGEDPMSRQCVVDTPIGRPVVGHDDMFALPIYRLTVSSPALRADIEPSPTEHIVANTGEDDPRRRSAATNHGIERLANGRRQPVHDGTHVGSE